MWVVKSGEFDQAYKFGPISFRSARFVLTLGFMAYYWLNSGGFESVGFILFSLVGIALVLQERSIFAAYRSAKLLKQFPS